MSSSALGEQLQQNQTKEESNYAPIDFSGARPVTPATGEEDQTAPSWTPDKSVPQPGTTRPNDQYRMDIGATGEEQTQRPTDVQLLKSTFGQAIESSPLGTMYKQLRDDLVSYQNNDTIQPDVANKMFPDRPVPYSTPISKSVVEMEINDKKQRDQIDEWVNRRSNGGFFKASGAIAGSVIGDPLTVLASLGTGGAAGGVIDALEAGGTTVSRLARMAIFGGTELGTVVGSQYLNAKAQEQLGGEKADLSDIMKNAVPWVAGLQLAKFALGARFSTASEEQMRKTLANMFQDKQLPTPKAPPPEAAQAPVAPTKAGSLHTVVGPDGRSLAPEPFLRGGVQAFKNPDDAVNALKDTTHGRVHPIAMNSSEAKFLPLDGPAFSPEGKLTTVAEEALSAVKSESPEAAQALQQALDTGKSLKTAFDLLAAKPQVLDDISAALKKAGYSGLEFASQGRPMVHIFDPANSIEAGEGHTLSPEAQQAQLESKTNMQPEDTAQERKEASLMYDKDADKAVHDDSKTSKTIHPNLDVDKTLQEHEENAKELEQKVRDLAKSNPALQETLNQLLDEAKRDQILDERAIDMAKRLVNCTGGGGL